MLDRLSLLKLYATYIRSLLEYASIIWDNRSIENKRNLESIQIEAARIITGATKLCSIQKLYDDTGNYKHFRRHETTTNYSSYIKF